MLDEAGANFIAELAASGVRPIHALTPEQGREAGQRMVELYGPGPAMTRAENVELAAADGGRIGLRVLVARENARGVIVYYHGGGWVLGALDQFDTLATCSATESRATSPPGSRKARRWCSAARGPRRTRAAISCSRRCSPT